MRLLGGYIGEADAAAGLFREEIREKLSRLSEVASEKRLTLQARWAMMRSCEAGIRWKFMATHPKITAECAEYVDAYIAREIFALLPKDATPTHKSRSLVYLPLATGGLGFLPFAQHADDLFRTTASMAVWPPLALTQENGALERAVTIRTVAVAMRDLLARPAVELLGSHEARVRADESTPWFLISAPVKCLRIRDDAWSLHMANYLRCEVPYPTCGGPCPHALSFDHSLCCHKCGAPYRKPRHSLVISTFRAVASAYGIQCSENFFGTLGVAPIAKRPDVIVYRNALDLKPLVLDMSTPHQAADHHFNAVSIRWQQKTHKYSEWKADLTEFRPFVVSPLALFESRTLTELDALAKLACRRGFARDCVNRIKVALVNFEPYRLASLRLRAASGSLHFNHPEPLVGADEISEDEREGASRAEGSSSSPPRRAA